MSDIATTPAAPDPVLPGHFVRDTLLRPKKMSVTAAAKFLGIGRPALSNFLNGNAAVSSDMAARIERAFNIPAQKLLDLQATVDAARAKTKGAPANTRTYVPPFLQIKANEIEAWSTSNIGARSRLSVFLRTLVNSTGIGLTAVDFPGNDDAERTGWDGVTVATKGTPWVPEARCGWEFGCNLDVKSKADGDYAKATKAATKTARVERLETTFVFVSPRRWPGKTQWVSDRRAEKKWKSVLAYDASDLEQWLEQSVVGQAWFAGETQRAASGARSLDQCWAEWASVTNPPLVGTLFSEAAADAKDLIAARLSKPPEEPLVIAADSTGEALAFLSELFSDAVGNLAAYRDRVVVFDEAGVLPKLGAGSSNFIAVATTREVELELAPNCRSIHSIIVCPRNANNASPHIVLDPLSSEAFRAALDAMGFNREEIDLLSHESGRSPTILRRRLATIGAIRTPAWAVDPDTATRLVPILFAGAWCSTNPNDRAILELLAEKDYASLEKEVHTLGRLDDAPVWTVGTYRGVISKLDLLLAIGSSISAPELERYFSVARYVLSEEDPAVDLPQKDRWAAGLFHKTREISGALRESISETLVLLAVHGNRLFRSKLGVDAEAMINRVIRELLEPLTLRKLESHERDLPTYAEAAPDTFLQILEDDLRSAEPASVAFMRPAETGVLGGCGRAGLLWALENTAWAPGALSRATLILARLAEIKISDNWSNIPIRSLESIFRSWMPQTAGTLQQRIDTIRLLAERFPSIAWKLCIAQFGHQLQRIGHYTHKPRWRADARGFGEPIAYPDVHAFELAMVEMALGWKPHDATTVGELIERLHGLDETLQNALWDLVQRWGESASDSDKACVRDKIRITVMSRRGIARANKQPGGRLQIAAQAAYEALEPVDIINKHLWLFREGWVEESADDTLEDDMGFHQREERTAQLRSEALTAILTERGLEGILELADRGKAADQIGLLMASRVLPADQVAPFILVTRGSTTSVAPWARNRLACGALSGLDDARRVKVLKEIRQTLGQEEFAALLRLAPFRHSTWCLVDELDTSSHHLYWTEITPQWMTQEDDMNEAVDRLLTAERPRAAFSCVHFALGKLKPSILVRLMTAIAAGGRESPEHYKLEPYYIVAAFTILDRSGELSSEQMAGLEYAYIDVLSTKWGVDEPRGVPYLERYLNDHPELFVEAISWLYKRNDGGEDPDSLRVVDADLVQHRASRAYALLDAIVRLPGRDKMGEVEPARLLLWVNTVRQACAVLGRQQPADYALGKMFSHAPRGADGVWPCESIRDVLEQLQSRDISEGVTVGLFNSRGVHARGNGGDQERVLADRYHAWASALAFSHPFVASSILRYMGNLYTDQAKGQDADAGIRRRLR